LIRVDTTNPPGNETAAAELLRDYLEANGVACKLYAKMPERANLVARIRGADGPTLALLSHTDVVVADAGEWQRDPFGGELVNGDVWGRGALDMKGQVAASAVAVASLAREGWRPEGELVFVAAADEEVGAGYGLQWLVEAHPDAVRADYSLNEGGGERLELGGRAFYVCASAEKMSAPFRLRVRGRSGHASMPGIADNALLKAAALVQRLGEYRPEPRAEPEVVALLEAVTGRRPATAAALLPVARSVDALLGALIEPLLGPTFAPTMASASEKRNVIPAVCEIVVDSRLFPARRLPSSSSLSAPSSAPASTSSSRSRRTAGRGPLSAGRSGMRSSPSSQRRSRRRSSCRSASPVSPTATGSAPPSGPSRTGSSRRVRCTRRRRPG